MHDSTTSEHGGDTALAAPRSAVEYRNGHGRGFLRGLPRIDPATALDARIAAEPRAKTRRGGHRPVLPPGPVSCPDGPGTAA